MTEPDNRLFLSASQAAASLPGRVSPATVIRWIVDGLTVGRGANRRTIRLHAETCGSRYVIHPDDLAEFHERRRQAVDGPLAEASRRNEIIVGTHRQIERAARIRHRRAIEQLRRMNVM